MTDFCHIPLSHYYAFGEVMREPELCQCFLETVLEIKIRRLVFVEKEHEMSDTWAAHGIRLDVYVEDDANSVYSIEMQNDVETMKRVRYYQSNIDRYLLERGQHYSILKQSFIIMVCNYDAVGLGYPAYWRESVFKCPVGTGDYDDGSHVVLLNAKYDKKYAVDMPAVCEFLDLLNVEEDVPPETIAAAAQAEGAKMVGLSALMTTTLPAMEETVRLLRQLPTPPFVLVGGAVVTPEYARAMGADGYAKDARAAVAAARQVFGA